MGNLIQFDEMPPELHRELSVRGGKASGEARRKKAALRKAMTVQLEQAALAAEFIDDIDEFNRWKKQRDKASASRERSKSEQRENYFGGESWNDKLT